MTCSPEARPGLGFESGYFQSLERRRGHGTERTLGISEQTYYKWRREYGGLKLDQAKRLKDLERENERLKKAASELTLDKLILKEALTGNVWFAPSVQVRERLPRAVCANVSGLSRMDCCCSQAMMRSARVVPN